MVCHVALIACPTLSLSVPENTPFTAVLKFAAEEVSSWVSLRIWSRQSVMVTISFLCLVPALQFKVPPATSAIITNGMFISDSHSSLYSVMKPGGMGAWEWNMGVWEPGNETWDMGAWEWNMGVWEPGNETWDIGAWEWNLGYGSLGMRSTLVCALLGHVRAWSCAHDSHGELTDATL